jgi:tetratricopeptide (TPR) repeat protein
MISGLKGDLQMRIESYEYLKEAADLYFSERYLDLLQQVESRARLPTSFPAWQLILISALRSDLCSEDGQFARFVANLLEPHLRHDECLLTLFLLARGTVTFREAIAKDTDPQYISQCHYYHGTFLKTNGDPLAAVKNFEECIRIKSGSYDIWLALRELRGELWKHFTPPDARSYFGVPLLLWQAARCVDKDNAAQGKDALRKAESRLQKVQPHPELEYAMALSDLAGLYRRVGQTERAAALVQNALETLEPHAIQHPGILLGLIDKYFATESPDKPNRALVSYLERAISLQKSIYDNPSEVASRVEKFAQRAAYAERLPEAIAAARLTIALREGCHDDVYLIYNARRFLVECLFRADQLATAYQEAIKVLAVAKRVQKASSKDLTMDLEIAVHLAQEAGISETDLDTLLRCLEEAPEISAQCRAKLQHRIARLFQAQRRHWKTIELLRPLSDFFVEPDEKYGVYVALADSYRNIGDLALAQACIDKCQQMAGTLSREALAAVYVLDAELAYGRGDRSAGDIALERASEVSEGQMKMQHCILNVLAGYYGPRGNYDLLTKPLADAIETTAISSLGSTEARQLGAQLNNAGLAAMSVGDLDAAQSFFNQALGTYVQDQNTVSLDSTLLMNYAKFFLLKGDCKNGVSWMTRALEAENREIPWMLEAASNRQRLIFLEKIRSSFETYLSLIFSQEPHERDSESAFKLVLQRKGIDLDVLATRRRLMASPAGERVRAILHELSSLQRKLTARGWSSARGSETTTSDSATAQIEDLQSELAGIWAEEVGHSAPFEVIPIDVRKRLAKDEALLEYVLYRPYDFSRTKNAYGPARYAVIAVKGGETQSVHALDLEEADVVDNQIRSLLTLIDSSQGTAIRHFSGAGGSNVASTWTKLRADLFDTLVGPVRSVLHGVRKLKVATDGQLGLFPFELLEFEPQTDVANPLSIDYLTSAREMLGGRMPNIPYAEDDLVVASPDFELCLAQPTHTNEVHQSFRHSELHGRLGDQRIGFSSLGGAFEEGKVVSELLHCRLWHGPEALDGRIKKLRSPRVLHVATHGFFQPRPTQPRSGKSLIPEIPPVFPFEAGLVFAGANAFLRGNALPDDAEDGFLFADEIAVMDLAGTELVTLSACESGLGTVMCGEGVTGLRRAFLAAGVRTLIVSLWKIPDVETVAFMRLFYGELKTGKTCGDALRSAKNKIRESSTSAPRLWAAFVCVGDSDNRLF